MQHPTATTCGELWCFPQHPAPWRSHSAKIRAPLPSITHQSCTPVLPASSRGNTPGQRGACGRDPGTVSGAGGAEVHMQLHGVGCGEANASACPGWARRVGKQRGPRGIAPEGNQQNRRKFKRLQPKLGLGGGAGLWLWSPCWVPGALDAAQSFASDPEQRHRGEANQRRCCWWRDQRERWQRRGHYLQKPFGSCYACISHLAHDKSFANTPTFPPLPCTLGVREK